MRLKQIIFLLVSLFVMSIFSQKYASGQTVRILGSATYVMRNEYGAQATTSVDHVRHETHLPMRYDNADGAQALKEIYNTTIPAQIRQTFDRTILDCAACSDCAFTVLDGGEQVSIFTKKFIIVGLEPDGSGDIVATLMFEGARYPFLLRMDNIGGGRHELRNMAELPGLLGEGFLRQLQSPTYRRYWW